MFLDNSACNLSSLNLMKFVEPTGEFKIEKRFPFQRCELGHAALRPVAGPSAPPVGFPFSSEYWGQED
jgi:hypothetical protein